MSSSLDRVRGETPASQRTTDTLADRSARRVIGQPAEGEEQRTVGQLVADASADVSLLVNREIQLAKTEVTRGLKVGGQGAGFLGAAAFLGLLGLIFLFHTLAHVLDIFLPLWAGYLIVTLLLLLVAGLLAFLGIRKVKQAKPVPEKAIRNAQETMAAIKSSS